VVAVCLLVGAPPPAAGADGRALLRIGHLSPDTPAFDVAVAPLPADGQPLTDPGPDVVRALRYGDLSDFTEFPPGAYAVSLRPAGSPPSTPPSLSRRVDLPPDGARTVALTGSFAELSTEVLTEDLSAPPEGTAQVRTLVATAGEAPDVRIGDGPGLPAGDPVPVPAGPATLRIGTTALPVDLAAGSVVTVLVLDRPDGGLTARVVLDAAAPARVPVGGVEAGSGPGGFPAAAAALALAVVAALRGRRRLVLTTTGAVLAGLLTVPAAAAAVPAPPTIATDVADRAVPTWVRIPAAGVDSALPAVGLDGAGALLPPAEGAGWYAGGPVPGDTGPAVITGHVDWAGSPAVFARLDELTVGDEVVVSHADGTTTAFTVTRVDRHPKSGFPSAAVYGATPRSELRLITCGGAFDRATGSYRDNVVVTAVAG
jgi:hypothetical protein